MGVPPFENGMPQEVASAPVEEAPITTTAAAAAVVATPSAADVGGQKRSAEEAGIASLAETKGSSTVTKKLTAEQKIERRERNREHAKRSRLRKKFLLESLQEQIHGLQDEIETLKDIIKTEIPDKAESLLSALSGSQQNFAISDPSLPDNPIVYVSQGFLDLTGYNLDQVLGRNCRFLQGPGTDQSAVEVIRRGIKEGVDTSVCLLNYKADGTPFWNQFFVAALRDAENNVVNFVGCNVRFPRQLWNHKCPRGKEREEEEEEGGTVKRRKKKERYCVRRSFFHV